MLQVCFRRPWCPSTNDGKLNALRVRRAAPGQASPNLNGTSPTRAQLSPIPTPQPTLTELHRSRDLVPKPSKPSLSIPQFLRPNRPPKAPATSIHRALLVSEILCLIFDFIRLFDESPESEHKWDRDSGKRTLASLARTCRTLSEPALDALWMRLDNLDPLIKVLPRRMWAKKHYPFVVRPVYSLHVLTAQPLPAGPLVHGRETVGDFSQIRNTRKVCPGSLLACVCHGPEQHPRCSCTIPKSFAPVAPQSHRTRMERTQDVKSDRSQRVAYQILCWPSRQHRIAPPHLLAQPCFL